MMMRSRRAFVYDGRNLSAGETFELVEPTAEGKSAARRVLIDAALAEAVDLDDGSPVVVPKYRPLKRRYGRRDLRAEK
jgi:hypothetical protein